MLLFSWAERESWAPQVAMNPRSMKGESPRPTHACPHVPLRFVQVIFLLAPKCTFNLVCFCTSTYAVPSNYYLLFCPSTKPYPYFYEKCVLLSTQHPSVLWGICIG